MYAVVGFTLENCDGQYTTGYVWTLEAVFPCWLRKERKEQTTPFGVHSMRTQVFYRAA